MWLCSHSGAANRASRRIQIISEIIRFKIIAVRLDPPSLLPQLLKKPKVLFMCSNTLCQLLAASCYNDDTVCWVWILLTEPIKTLLLLTLHNGQTVHVHQRDDGENMQGVSLYTASMECGMVFLDTRSCLGFWYGICLFPERREIEKPKTCVWILSGTWMRMQIQNSFVF